MSYLNHYRHFFIILNGLCYFLNYCIASRTGYDFAKIEYVNEVWQSNHPDTFTMGQNLTSTHSAYYKELCTAAGKFVSTPDEKFDKGFTDARVVPSILKIFGDEEIWTNPFQVLWCEVTPQFWIRVGINNELILLLKFKLSAIDKDYSFDIEHVESDPVPFVHGDVGAKTTQLFICAAAIERIFGDPLSSDKQIAVPQPLEGNVKLFQFKNASGQEKKRVLLACPSHPPVYAYYDDTEKNIKVLVKRIEHNVPPAPSSVHQK